MAANIMNDVKWVADHSKQKAQAPPPSPAAKKMAMQDQTAVILRNFQKQEMEKSGGMIPAASPQLSPNAFLKDDTDTHHWAQAGVHKSSVPLWRTIVHAHNVPAVDLQSKSKMLLKHMKEVEKITGRKSLSHLKSFKSHYLKELHTLKKTASSDNKSKKATAPAVKVHEKGAHPVEEDQIKKKMRDTMKSRMVKVAKYVGESSTSNVVTAGTDATGSDSTSTTKSAKYLQKIDKHMSLAGKRLQKEMAIAKKEAEHTDHGHGPVTSDEGDIEAPPPPPTPLSGPAGFIAAHTFNAKESPEVQWQLAGHGQSEQTEDAEHAYEETEGDGEGEIDHQAPDSTPVEGSFAHDHEPGSDAMAKMNVARVQHEVAMIGGKEGA
jgi:hypothetical protein